jgi:anti-sigma factor RsiW
MKTSLSVEILELHAYVDGQLGVEGRRRVEAYVEQHPEALEQIKDYQILKQQIQSLFNPVADEPVPDRFLRPRARVGLWRHLKTLVAAGLILATGISIGLYLGTDLEFAEHAGLDDIDHIVNETVMAYAVYTPEVQHPVEVGADQKDHLVEWLSKRMGTHMRVPKLNQLGMQLIGGRLLATEYGPGALLMYESNAGRRIVLYACESDEKATAFHFAEQQDVLVYYWIDGKLSYAVAGRIPRDKLLPLAKSAYDQLTF